MNNSYNLPKQKTLNSQIAMYDDPIYKEFELIPIEKFKQERERANKDYHQLIIDLHNMKEDFKATKKRAKDREEDLREYINNLLIKYRTRDPHKNLLNMNSLQEQIIDNIQTLEAQSKDDIRDKKKDLETRIKLRLVDSEINYNKELEKKQKEQEGIISSLEEVTSDMLNIRNNFNSIKRREYNFREENSKFKSKIIQYEKENAALKAEIMQLKHVNNKYAIQIMSKKKEEEDNDGHANGNGDGEEGEEDMDVDEKMSRAKIIAKEKLASMDKKKFKDKLKARHPPMNEEKNSLLSSQEIVAQLTIDKIVELLTNEDYLRKHYKYCAIISSLLSLYDKTNQRLNNLTTQLNSYSDKHPIYDHLQSLIQVLKNQEINSKLKYVNSMSKRMINDLLGNYTVIMNKAQRTGLIETIISDKFIMETISDERLPNIINKERQLGRTPIGSK